MKRLSRLSLTATLALALAAVVSAASDAAGPKVVVENNELKLLLDGAEAMAQAALDDLADDTGNFQQDMKKELEELAGKEGAKAWPDISEAMKAMQSRVQALLDAGRALVGGPKEGGQLPKNVEIEIVEVRDCRRPCPRNYDPVCASDGKTYANDCVMSVIGCESNAALSVIHKGACEESNAMESTEESEKSTVSADFCPKDCPPVLRLVCGSDAVTYDNLCELQKASCEKNAERIRVAHFGSCGDDHHEGHHHKHHHHGHHHEAQGGQRYFRCRAKMLLACVIFAGSLLCLVAGLVQLAFRRQAQAHARDTLDDGPPSYAVLKKEGATTADGCDDGECDGGEGAEERKLLSKV